MTEDSSILAMTERPGKSLDDVLRTREVKLLC